MMSEKAKQQRREWYVRNRDFLREFESKLPFLVYRNQRERVLRLKRQLNHEICILGRYRVKMKEFKEKFKETFKVQTKCSEDNTNRAV